MTTFYIARHGETEWNTKKLLQGQTDSPLTDKGIAQAQQLGEEFKDIVFDAAFSSDLLRAKRTAEIVTLERELVVNTHELLRERSFGTYEGKSPDTFVQENRALIKQFVSLSREEQTTFKYNDDIENNEELITRMITFLREVAVAYPDKTILVVSHGGIMKALLIHLGSVSATDEMTNTAYVKIESDGVDFFVKEMKGIVAGGSRRTNVHHPTH